MQLELEPEASHTDYDDLVRVVSGHLPDGCERSALPTIKHPSRPIANTGVVLYDLRKWRREAETFRGGDSISARAIPGAPSILDAADSDSAECSAQREELARLRAMMARRTGEVPDALCCPISMEIMRDPVIAADGHTYERAEIEAWFANNRTSPTVWKSTDAMIQHERAVKF